MRVAAIVVARRSRPSESRATRCARRAIPAVEGGVAELDEPFPGLAGEAVAGPPIDTATIDAAVLVVNVWATWCEPCRREQPALLEVQAPSTPGEGVEFVGVDYRDDRAAATRWIEDFDVPYPSLFDPQGRTAASLGFPFLPDTYLVDASGTMRYAIYGETSAEELSGLDRRAARRDAVKSQRPRDPAPGAQTTASSATAPNSAAR